MKRLLRRAADALAMQLFGSPDADPYHQAFADFFARVNALPAPRVLEIGARARSGNTYKERLKPDTRYLGLDITKGYNVDIVADAHQLDSLFRPGSFDAVFSVSVFEHLAMPWKAAAAMGSALREGGLLFIATHPTYPPHEEPWDFFRFQPGAFRSLFNAATGFEVIKISQGLPCRIVPLASDPPLRTMWRERAYLGVACIARKIGTASGDVSLKDITDGTYPSPSPSPSPGPSPSPSKRVRDPKLG